MSTAWNDPHGKILKTDILGRKILEFCSHALDRMIERGVTEAQVIRTIEDPHRTGLPTQPKRSRVARKASSYREIQVVYEKRKDRVIVVTVISKEIPQTRKPRKKARKKK